jgi:DNA-binding IclR family transcriptional regulator
MPSHERGAVSRSWTFLSSHGLVLLAVASDPSATQRAIAAAVGITERAVQRLIADLVDAGYLRRIAEGRRNRYELVEGPRLRHPLSRDTPVHDLLRLVAREGTDAGDDVSA